MDGSAFDRAVRAFVAEGSRRRLLGLLTGLPLLGLLSRSDVAKARPGRKAHRHHAQHPHHHTTTQRRKDDHGDTHSEACIPTGQRCPAKKPRGKHHTHLSCQHCCQGTSHTEADGKQYCGCQPNGGACTADTASSCCSGFCNGATCQAAPCSAAIPCPQCQTCNATTGLCEAIADGTVCNDGNACTQTDTCQGGVCVGSNPVVCPSPIDQCHAAGTCNPATGTCSNPAQPNGTACNDGNLCTTGETCQSGVCGGTPVVCPATACEIPGACDPATGCLPAGFKAPNTPCSGGVCCGGSLCQAVECCNDAGCDSGQDCVDGDCVCTTSSCHAGCCAGTTCEAGDTITACGEGGVTCVTCSADMAVTCRNSDGINGTCVRGCMSGSDCGGGTCSCASTPDGGNACVTFQPGNFSCFASPAACAANCPSGRVCTSINGPCVGLTPILCATACANT